MSALSAYTASAKHPIDSQEGIGSVQHLQQSEARLQAKSNWKESTVTQELVKELQIEYNDLLQKSISLAVAYPQTSNHQQIIQNLIRVDQIQKFLDKYIYGK